MTFGQNGVLRYGHFGELLEFVGDIMVNLGLIDFKLCLYIKVKGGGGGGGGVQAFHFGKTDFELGVVGEGQDTSRHFEGSFGSIRGILPM